MPRPHQHGEAYRDAAEQLAGVGRIQQCVAGVAPARPERQGLAELHFPIPRHLDARTSGFLRRTAPRGGASRDSATANQVGALKRSREGTLGLSEKLKASSGLALKS